MYHGKNCVEKFIEHIEKEIKRLYAILSHQLITKLTGVLKREHEAAEKCHICLKEFNNPEDRKVRDHCRGNHCQRVYIEEQPTTIATLNTDTRPHTYCVSQL